MTKLYRARSAYQVQLMWQTPGMSHEATIIVLANDSEDAEAAAREYLYHEHPSTTVIGLKINASTAPRIIIDATKRKAAKG